MGPGLALRAIRDDTIGRVSREPAMPARERTYWVYIFASGRAGTLYIGVTSDLIGRVYEHREGLTPGFTSLYGVKHLVYFEPFDDINAAIEREKRLKRWRRDWKLNLIERHNPEWVDLYVGMARGMWA
jgi:putative endonuclease